MNESNIEEYTTGTGQKLNNIHSKEKCKGRHCAIHNPSIDWPTNWRDGWSFMEAMCPCGVGYPHPDDHSDNAAGRAFGVCGNKVCMDKWVEACGKSWEKVDNKQP